MFSVHFCQTWHPGQSTPIESLATVPSSSIVTTHALGAECCVPSESFPACEHTWVLLMSVSRETWGDRSACSRLARGWLAFLMTAAGTGHSPAFSASLVAMCCVGKSADLGVHLSRKVAVLGLLLLLWNSWRRLFVRGCGDCSPCLCLIPCTVLGPLYGCSSPGWDCLFLHARLHVGEAFMTEYTSGDF